MMKNNEWKWVYLSLFAAVVFGIFMVVAGGMDCMSGGCAIVFISIFLLISSFAVALLFFTRARAMDAILAEKNPLAHWVYGEEETRNSAEREYREYRENNRSLLRVVGVFLGIAMVGMVIFGGEGGITTAVVLFIVFLLCAITSVVAPVLERNRALKAVREAYITKEGIIYEGSVYPFSSFMMRMDGVRYRKRTANIPGILGFSFMQLVGLYIMRPFEISIPVPPGEEEDAVRIAGLLGGAAEEEGGILPETV